nr:hypothetical protein [Tanacetum cinerariifolium]
LIKSMLNNDSSIIIPSKIDSLLDEFAGELTLLKSIPSGIDETDCHLEEEIRLTKRLLYDNSSPRPPEEFVSDNSNADIKSFSPSPVPIKDSDSHMKEIDLSLNPDEPNSRDFAKDVVENISPTKEPQVLNTLPTHPTLQLNLKFQPSRESLFFYVVLIFLPFLVYSVVPCYLLSLRNEDIIFDPGICKYHFSKPDISHRCEIVKTFNTHQKYFVEYTGIEVKHFRDTLLQHMGNVKKSVFERARHQRQYDRRVNKRLMQTQESKIDIDEAKKNTQERDRNSKPSMMTPARFQSATADSKPKPRSTNHSSRSLPMSKSSCEMNSRAKIQSHKTRNRIKPVDQKSHTQIPGRQIFTGHKFSPNKTSAVYEKISPRSDLRWQPTGRIFKSIGLRWLPIGKLFDTCTNKVESEPPHGSNVDISKIHECKQTLDLIAGTSINVPKEQNLNASADQLSSDPAPECQTMASDQNSFDPAPECQTMASNHLSSDLTPECQTMASDQLSFDPVPECQTMALNHDSLSPAIQRQGKATQADRTVTTSNELDLLFSPMFDELLNGSSKIVSKSSVVSAADAPNQRQQYITPLNNHTTPAPLC